MINIRKITDATIYTLGAWTSQVLTNSLSGMPTGITTEWGSLNWDEEYTGTGYDGQVRIDILDSTGAVLISDIVKNTDGTPTDLSATTASTSDIMIKVKVYGLSIPTPKVSNIWVQYKNWLGKQVVTTTGKNLLIIKGASSASTPISTGMIGNGQITDFSKDSTALTTPISSAIAFNSVSLNTASSTVLTETIVDSEVTDGTIMNAVSFSNTDSTPAFCAAARFSDITKTAGYKYHIFARYKVIGFPATTYKMTQAGRNVFVDRAFYASPAYNAVDTGVLGTLITGSLSDTMNQLDTTIITNAFDAISFDLGSNKVTFRSSLNTTTGNESTFSGIGHIASNPTPEDTESTSKFVYASVFDAPFLKTSTYQYIFTVQYSILPETSLIG